MIQLPTLPTWAGTVLKYLPYALMVAAAVALYMASGKIDSLKAQLDAANDTIETRTIQRDFFKSAVEQRDKLLDIQSASIDAIAAQARADRTSYEKGLATARELSATNVAAANDLLALQAPEGELAQCRASRDLLEGELVQ